jgi:Fe-S-cluster containining protein
MDSDNLPEYLDRSGRTGQPPMDQYLELRERVSGEAGALFDHYRPHLQCRRGCYYCCDPITILPIEIAALRDWLHENGTPDPESLGGPPDDPLPRCHFLGRDGACTVYGGRPIICRTHGLPLSYREYEYDMLGDEIDPLHPHYSELWCELNFTAVPDDEVGNLFDAGGKINMHLINEELERLNELFLATDAGSEFIPQDDAAHGRYLLSRALPDHPAPAP